MDIVKMDILVTRLQQRHPEPRLRVDELKKLVRLSHNFPRKDGNVSVEWSYNNNLIKFANN
eukprot:snap_masked-scaffold_4-processed-gene-0.15-mRNA-1 protein AED:1.00 eAED:1.00 QI:0/0/0/0/1/1/2/0/60